MDKPLLCWFLLSVLIFTTKSNARPVSYAGGWTIMQMNDLNKHSFHFHYSPSIKYSIGYKSEFWRKKEWQFHGTQINYLIKRINTSKSQTNFYLKNGLGIALSDYESLEKKIEPNFFSGLSVDWEDRQYFTSYENRINYNSTIDKFFVQKARVGYSPYIGEYGDLHTWFIFEIQHMPNVQNKIVFTPLLRMFKGDYLVETGLSNNNNFTFNFVKRF
tara:strand:+ start:259 stop:906 length:648 start_codon:yes stop_codon:yes gene_type:complete